MPRSRNYVFTWNNYPPNCDLLLAALEVRYIIYGREAAPGTGTPHLQGYVCWNNAKSLAAAIKELPGCHVEQARGSVTACVEYCSKDGDFIEIGNRPVDPVERGRKERDRWIAAWTHAQSGSFEEIDADIRLRCYHTLKRVHQDYMPRVEPLDGVCGYWIYGESGCGKTRGVLSAYPSAFLKPRHKWWDGYQNEEVILLDDVDKFDVKLGGFLKHWADFAPFIAECKGGSRRIRPKRFIVTSQYRIEEIWDDKETQDALGRRFTVITKTPGQELLWG